ncbi:hypothetical protein CROQUDRAFT_61369 [Cronartium quercuum f. sp. fusiforme G11]|uniref:Succinate dehydrogenase subunit C n=1 Tax=Cronartium quercuum f. sp. fusiforme G11 TaxID=708437 RepID=A0A9P6NIS8_9BASI|nr:hypothetical protein CROQUDRAFT_61369 [Cronartium quercuum f. sp. fusiforme G11]
MAAARTPLSLLYAGSSSRMFLTRSQPSLLQLVNSCQQQQRSSSSKVSQVSGDEAMGILNQQRKLRPISPHFTIYEPQLTWYSSLANRVTGSALSIGLYAFALSYLTLPAVGIPMDSDAIVQLATSAPEWSKVTTKGLLALPFTYHTFNGCRHLAWDLGYFMELKSSYTAGYAVLGATAVSTVGLALM